LRIARKTGGSAWPIPAARKHRRVVQFSDAEANRWLTPPEYRQPWVLPKIDEL